MQKKKSNLFSKLLHSKRAKLAVLVDPDKFNKKLILSANQKNVSCFLVGGSILEKGDVKKTVRTIKSLSKIPIILFPGDETQLCKEADGLFLISLLSGRNPDYLIGKHVLAAPQIKKLKLKHIPVAYLLIGDKSNSSTQKITKTKPLKMKVVVEYAIRLWPQSNWALRQFILRLEADQKNPFLNN